MPIGSSVILGLFAIAFYYIEWDININNEKTDFFCLFMLMQYCPSPHKGKDV